MLVADVGGRAVGQDEEEEPVAVQAPVSNGVNDLLGGVSGGAAATTTAPAFDLDSMLGGPATQPAAQVQPAAGGGLDALNDIFGGGGVSQPVTQTQ